MDVRRIPSLRVADYIVFATSVVLSLGIGLFYSCKGGQRKTAEEYFVGGRKLNVVPVMLSLVVSFESSIMMLGMPAETYLYGGQYCIAYICIAITLLFCTFAFVPMLHALKLTSIYEYIEKRYNSKAVRLVGTTNQTIVYLIYMGIVLLGPALALQSVSGFPLYISIAVIALCAIIYTSVGGIKAVVWTDLFQFIVMVTGLLAVIIKGTMQAGGVAEVYRRNADTGRTKIIFDPDPRIRMSFWNVGVVYFLRYAGHVFGQTSVQRISSMPTAAAAKKVFGWALPFTAMFGFLAVLCGLVAFAYFDFTKCDPIVSKRVANPNQIMVLLVLELFEDYPGMAGLFLASLFSASLSTLSSCLGSVSTNFWEDIVRPLVKRIPQNKGTLVAKCAVICGGIIAVGISFLAVEVGGSLALITSIFMGGMLAPLSGMYVCAAMFPFVHSRGIVSGILVSFTVSIWLSIGRAFSKFDTDTVPLKPASTEFCYVNSSTMFNYTVFDTPATSVSSTTAFFNVTSPTTSRLESAQGIEVLYSLSPFLYSPICISLCIVVSVITSFILGHKESDKVEEKYLSPVALKIWSCTPVKSKYIKKKDLIKSVKLKLLSPDQPSA